MASSPLLAHGHPGAPQGVPAHVVLSVPDAWGPRGARRVPGEDAGVSSWTSPHLPLSPLFTGNPDTLPFAILSGGLFTRLLSCPVPGVGRHSLRVMSGGTRLCLFYLFDI